MYQNSIAYSICFWGKNPQNSKKCDESQKNVFFAEIEFRNLNRIM